MANARIAPATDFRPFDRPLPGGTKPWQRRPETQILVALAAMLPMAAIGVWTYLLRESAMGINEMMLGPLLGGGSLIFWILFLHLFVCGDGLAELGFRATRPWLEIGLGVAMSLVLLAFHFTIGPAISRLFPPRPPTEEMVTLLTGLVRNPWLLALWLGPVVWIGVALFEELLRVFVLRRLWQVWNGPIGKWAVVLVVSGLVGLAHGYQGTAAIVSISIMSIFKGWFYMITGRVWVLIIAHALYDSIQIVMAVIAIRGLG